ncbi:LacI family DNA-binding transcriptional regulator [Cerasicoccus maritimus]|uniref:LacI family DNA-binding transcriptional regulator n=1 Tax=Cerasicoccus maritimus TaxID=490089 RepID=UPI0028526E75|nr:LacI family DNA-binding transcriptional regulator [Cerasicoccus maritimus]
MPQNLKVEKGAKRTTQKDLANELGLAQSTVSMALRHHPDLPQETIDRVLKHAKKIGYRPDPYLTGLAAYRKKNAPAHYTATVAWLSVVPTEWCWRHSRIYSAYFDGACQRAEELGYRIEEHVFDLEKDNSKSLKRVFNARNIQGILIAPLPGYDNSLEFDFSRFYAIAFGFTLQSPKLHLVSHQHLQSAFMAMDELFSRGYRRIGCCISSESDRRTFHGWSAGVRSYQAKLRKEERIPIHFTEINQEGDELEWYLKAKPDVILTQGAHIYDILTAAGIAVPEDVGYAVLDAWKETPFLSGVDQNAHLTGARALELLVEKINIQEIGVPQIATHVLVEGSWNEGMTLRKRVE